MFNARASDKPHFRRMNTFAQGSGNGFLGAYDSGYGGAAGATGAGDMHHMSSADRKTHNHKHKDK